MKIYRITESGGRTTCTVDGLPLTLKRRSFEGEGPVPDRLALSILCDAIGDSGAMLLAQDFNEEILRKLLPQAEITSEDMEQWSNYHCELQYAVQTAKWKPVGSPEPEEYSQIPKFPKLLLNPNYRLSRNSTEPAHGI
jgi:hypothetical protein